ncbi:MAG: hypothetical protein US90_C0008G0002 [Candidatus Shapirobacteria bacterium GW2011_GWE2_38_30]|uniref:Uncharacterized protein n=1 Tax=Candidatus Shapirobacteria bacterium GW2011_GWE2_38_30 TaxID=1618490 RepID=A0A0G0K3W0_9BACT|nr:MAG: hypothetical protein US90_C0008G0002 [Candidatus Shapirobacteria bacterium GW2011_GWE2_38_30]
MKVDLDFLRQRLVADLGGDGVEIGSGGGDIKDGFAGVVGDGLGVFDSQLRVTVESDGLIGNTDSPAVENKGGDTDELLAVGGGGER